MSDSSNTILGILAGTAIGAVVGILFAPDKGTNTRKKLKDQSNALIDDVGTKSTEIKEQVAEIISGKKESLEQQMDTMLTSASYKTEDVITALESKLKDLKAKNRKLRTSS
ncbi:YtxH domain-containing protein [Flagellimonas sp. 389]|uniref:YtxH domain-containing protein n=1 Tax=Flagellimonas sp. 389 TaxID=2835862 RepID=UPI001BD4C087|nr:YtxH domain-containing protein [Flagellimonas sp. 389]MBS9464308.1 YtxH domain-containing protein [Flagellimonas sp. 389]